MSPLTQGLNYRSACDAVMKSDLNTLSEQNSLFKIHADDTTLLVPFFRTRCITLTILNLVRHTTLEIQ